MNRNTTVLGGKQLVTVAVRKALDRKAENVTILDLGPSGGMADWFMICQADNPVHTRAIADAIEQALKEHATSPWHIEGRDQGRWILLDYTDVVVHVLLPDLREYYQLEELWEGIRRIDIPDEKALERSMFHESDDGLNDS